ncbi:MAG: IS110 family transposase [Halofilum sp. (in: g-proteobacteria)]|nr:IS110 family transposase [Halofilum sp. (in: g-proteobacteria)]
MKTVSRIGLDTAKNVFQVHAVDVSGETVTTRRLRRSQVLSWFARLDREAECVVGLEATGGSHYWARELVKLGYRVRILNPQAVKPYRQGQKNDARDAAAICEAVARESVAQTPIKSAEQQSLLAQQSFRRRLVNQRTALGNQLRGLLSEFGVVVGRGLGRLRRRLPELAEDAGNGLPDGLRRVLAEGYEELVELDQRIQAWDRQFAAQARADERARRLMEQAGIGPLTALRLVAVCGDGAAWRDGRAFGANMGFAPRQYSSGEQVRLGPITRRGDSELRTLLIHGARAAMRHLDDTTPLGRWVNELQRRRHKNVAAVALAHKNARIAWALLAHGTDYQPATDRPMA